VERLHALVEANANSWRESQDRVRNELKAQADRVRTRRHAVTQTTAAASLLNSENNLIPASATTFEDGVQRPSVTHHGQRQSISAHCEGALYVMCEDLAAQRQILVADSDETRLFERQWGLYVSAIVTDGHGQTYSVRTDVKLTLYDALMLTETRAVAERPRVLAGSAHGSGMMLLQSFVTDLLGRHSQVAMIFENITVLAFGQQSAVSWDFKVFAALVLCGLNACFTYYAIWIASHKGQKWQVCYVVAVLVQVAVEALILETAVTAAVFWALPTLIRDNMNAALTTLTQLVSNLCSECLPHNPEQLAEQMPEIARYFFSAPQYLFVSQKLALARPDLLESMLLLRYTSPLSGACGEAWPHVQATTTTSEGTAPTPHTEECEPLDETGAAVPTETVDHANRDGASDSLLVRTLTRGTLLIDKASCYLQQRGREFATVTPSYQRPLARLLLTVLLFGVALFALAASYNNVALALLVFVLGCMVCVALWYLAYRLHLAALHTKRVSPLQTESEAAGAAGTAGGEAASMGESSRNLLANVQKSQRLAEDDTSSSDSSTDSDVEKALRSDQQDVGATVFQFLRPPIGVEADDDVEKAVDVRVPIAVREVVGAVAKEVTTEATASAQGAVQCLAMLSRYRPPLSPVKAPAAPVSTEQEQSFLAHDAIHCSPHTDYATAATRVSQILQSPARLPKSALQSSRVRDELHFVDDELGTAPECANGDGLSAAMTEEPTPHSALPGGVDDAGPTGDTSVIPEDQATNGAVDSMHDSFSAHPSAGEAVSLHTSHAATFVSETVQCVSQRLTAQATSARVRSQEAHSYVHDAFQAASQKIVTRERSTKLRSEQAQVFVNDAVASVSQRLAARLQHAYGASAVEQQGSSGLDVTLSGGLQEDLGSYHSDSGDESPLEQEFKDFDSVFSGSDSDVDVEHLSEYASGSEDGEYKAFNSLFEERDDAFDAAHSEGSEVSVGYQAFDSIFEDDGDLEQGDSIYLGEVVWAAARGGTAPHHASTVTKPEHSPVRRQPSMQEWRAVLDVFDTSDSERGEL
jgi:hypothetical protein